MNTPPKHSRFKTSDGVELAWLESGSGPTLLMLPGWSQSAAMFHEQFAGLSDRRVHLAELTPNTFLGLAQFLFHGPAAAGLRYLTAERLPKEPLVLLTTGAITNAKS